MNDHVLTEYAVILSGQEIVTGSSTVIPQRAHQEDSSQKVEFRSQVPVIKPSVQYTPRTESTSVRTESHKETEVTTKAPNLTGTLVRTLSSPHKPTFLITDKELPSSNEDGSGGDAVSRSSWVFLYHNPKRQPPVTHINDPIDQPDHQTSDHQTEEGSITLVPEITLEVTQSFSENIRTLEPVNLPNDEDYSFASKLGDMSTGRASEAFHSTDFESIHYDEDEEISSTTQFHGWTVFGMRTTTTASQEMKDPSTKSVTGHVTPNFSTSPPPLTLGPNATTTNNGGYNHSFQANESQIEFRGEALLYIFFPHLNSISHTATFSGHGSPLSFLALGSILVTGLFLMVVIIIMAAVIYKKW